MTKSSALRVSPSADGVSIRSSEIFGATEAPRLRDFLSRAFSVSEVDQVELRRAKSFGRIRYSEVPNPATVWKKLGRALRSAGAETPLSEGLDSELDAGPVPRVDAGIVYLDGPAAKQVRISRVGSALTTWRVRHHTESTLRLSHPFLRNRKEVVFRLEEELAAILGIEDFRASALTGRVSIRFDAGKLTVDRLTRQLEKAWPRLLDGLDGPPSTKRFVAAVGLTGLAFTGQYLVPAVRPIAVVGVALYGLPNVVRAAKDLTRGQVGLGALYTTGLAFTLITGSPFASAVMATLMQMWPHAGHRKLVRAQRRLFAGQRRRPAWARIAHADGIDVEVSTDDLHQDDLVVVRAGEIVPVDGIVEDGYAAVVDAAPLGDGQVEDRSKGDAILAGAFVRDGNLTIRVQRIGEQTAAGYVESLLPHTSLPAMPSSLEAERVANRNAKPALALSALSFLLTQNLRMSRAVIRPDYVTAPRLSAQLSALHGIAHGLQRGVLFRNPAALDRLRLADIYVIDDSAALERRTLEVASIKTVNGVSTELLVGYALVALRQSRTEQGRALDAFASKTEAVDPNPRSLSRHAGVTRYRDGLGNLIEVVTPAYLAAANIDASVHFQAPAARRAKGKGRRVERIERIERVETTVGGDHPSLRPLWVLRDGVVIGVVSFARTGELIGRQVVSALRARHGSVQIVHVSQLAEPEARALAGGLGVDVSCGGLRPSAKADLVRGLGGKTLWMGDGSQPDSREVMTASSVSVSVASLPHLGEDAADILLPQKGFVGLLDAIDLGQAHAQRIKRDYRAVYAVNLLGVAGAYAASFTSLQAGLLSHLGSALAYTRHARHLDKLASSVEEKHTRLTRILPG